jgi:hypothetical protein
MMVKSKRMTWVGHVVRMGERRNRIKFWSETPEEIDHSEELEVDERIILEWIL